MLGYLTRFAATVGPALLGVRPDLRVSRLHRRVALRQIDLNLHMNQAAYAETFEWGRLDLLLRSGAIQHWRSRGVNPVVAEQRIVYRRELRPWARYVIDTRAVGVDGRLLCVQGHLVVGSQVHARADVKLIFIGPDGVLAPLAVPPLVESLLGAPLPVEGWKVQATSDP